MTSTEVDRLRLAAASARARQARAEESFWDFAARVRIVDYSNQQEVPFEMWKHLERRFQSWLSGNSEVILKARQEGFSWSLAVYAAWVARQKNTQVLMLSSQEDYAKELLGKVKYVLQTTGTPVVRETATEVNVRHGGIIKALPSTENAGRGFTGSLVIFDEAAFHEYAEQNASAIFPTVADGGGQILIVSTSNGALGFFFDLWMEAEEREFVQVFEPWWVRPGRDAEWERRTRNRMTAERFKREYPATPEEAFQLARGLVYGDTFDAARHMRPITEPPVPWSDCLYTYGGYDLGGGDPTAAGLVGVYKDPHDHLLKAHLYEVYYREDGSPTVDELYGVLAPYSPMKVICDPAPGGAMVQNSLEALGLVTETANNSRGVGIETVKLFLEKGWITFLEHPKLLREFRTYRWMTRYDNQSKTHHATSTPYDHHGDILDMLRYVLMAVYVDIWNAEGMSHAYSGAKW